MVDFHIHLTEEQYTELAQFWHEYMVLGPRRDEIGASLTAIALNFSEWIDSDEDESRYRLSEILAFFAEKERREGTAIPAAFTATDVPNS
jgi:hypothetical protein